MGRYDGEDYEPRGYFIKRLTEERDRLRAERDAAVRNYEDMKRQYANLSVAVAALADKWDTVLHLSMDYRVHKEQISDLRALLAETGNEG